MSPGVRVWSLTDHDTNSGWSEAEDECNKLGIRFIPGVEITCEVEMQSETHNPTSWHLLAYFPEGAPSGVHPVARQPQRCKITTYDENARSNE